jgi:hypothetical protein
MLDEKKPKEESLLFLLPAIVSKKGADIAGSGGRRHGGIDEVWMPCEDR